MSRVISLCRQPSLDRRLGRWVAQHPYLSYGLLWLVMPLGLLAAVFMLAAAIALPFAWLFGCL
ncbi:hypothetical protein [Bittarella massiliensis (ex Durand et al. 2017)]|uniref:hypothetical protein n=1 Tax=Bittarella massiliensis (ex Durand et al. 2017) TaxID=1720313 RepID=UPI001AA1B11C|nr:hypothetical protein [Bittarella massiliensis (ex Durand et al. 2017)]MBO1679639.1 hypothetical protein [Bittarella massiliensis (ex Durand et al. 2017)]